MINQLEMNVIEEQADEEDKSCASSFHKSNKNSNDYNSNDPYFINSTVSRENRKARDSFETFGQKSMAGIMSTIKSESKESRKNNLSVDSSVNQDSLNVDDLCPPLIQQSAVKEKTREKETTLEVHEEEKTHTTDEKYKRTLDVDASTDISAQVTKRNSNTKNSGYKGDQHTSSFSMPTLNFDNICKFKVDNQMSKDSSLNDNSGQVKQNRINIYEYGTPEDEQINLNMSQSDGSPISFQIQNESIKDIKDSKASKMIKDVSIDNGGDLAISSILERTCNNEETDILDY